MLIDRHKGAGDLTQRSRDGGKSSNHQYDRPGADRTRNAAKRYEHIRKPEDRSGYNATQHIDTFAGRKDLLPLPEEILGKLTVPPEQVVTQHKSPDLFNGARLYEQVTDILSLSFLRRFLVVVFVQFGGDTTFYGH